MIKQRLEISIVPPACLLMVVFSLCFIDRIEARNQEPVAETWSHSLEDSTGVIYVPEGRHFRPRYEEDGDNRARQNWDNYLKWVETFYSGNFLARGWTDECRNIVDRIHDPDQRNMVIKRMNVLGRLIAAEWAKDNAIRLIDTTDIREWGLWLREASIGNNMHIVFDVEPLLEALDGIESLVIEKLKSGRPARQDARRSLTH